MATTKYRIPVPLSDETNKAISYYAEVAGTSKAAACSLFLDELAPHIHGIAEALSEVGTNPEKAVRRIQKLAAESQRRLAEEQIEFWEGLPEKGK